MNTMTKIADHLYIGGATDEAAVTDVVADVSMDRSMAPYPHTVPTPFRPEPYDIYDLDGMKTESLMAFGDMINLHRQAGNVVIRCTFGRERSAFAAALALVREGTPAAGAIERVREARGEFTLREDLLLHLLHQVASAS